MVTGMTVALLGTAAYVGVARRDDVIKWAVDPNLLLWIIGGLAVVALFWVTIVVTSYKMLRPLGSGVGARLGGAFVIGLVCCTIASGTALGAQNLLAQRDLVTHVFAGGNSKSATRPTIKNKKDPWAQLPRLNLLLLGADDGAGRKDTRTDTVMVASIDTKTGDTKLISLTRNFMRMPFPEDSPLHKFYPTGFWNPKLGDKEQSEFYLDAMYRNVPRDHDGILGPSDNQGADVLKVSVGEALGLKLHYYLQINLSGFEQMVEALGGLTVNINYKVPIGGDYKGPGKADDILPTGYLQPGPNRHLNGHDALWFARGRYDVQGSDLARQDRQHCVIKALVERATPQNVLTNYQSIAKAGKQLIRTDIPQNLLGATRRARRAGQVGQDHQHRPGQEEELPQRPQPELRGHARDRRQSPHPENRPGREAHHHQTNRQTQATRKARPRRPRKLLRLQPAVASEPAGTPRSAGQRPR